MPVARFHENEKPKCRLCVMALFRHWRAAVLAGAFASAPLPTMRTLDNYISRKKIIPFLGCQMVWVIVRTGYKIGMDKYRSACVVFYLHGFHSK
jgi:hypothetical protein